MVGVRTRVSWSLFLFFLDHLVKSMKSHRQNKGNNGIPGLVEG